MEKPKHIWVSLWAKAGLGLDLLAALYEKPNLREGEGEGGDIKASVSCVGRKKERRSHFYLAKQRREAAFGAKSCQVPSSHWARSTKWAWTWWGANEGNAAAVEDVPQKTSWETNDLTGLQVPKEPGGGLGRAGECPVSDCCRRGGSNWREERKMWIFGDVSGTPVAVRFSLREASKLFGSQEGKRGGKGSRNQEKMA